MKVTPQAEYYGLAAPRSCGKEAKVDNPELFADLLKGPRLTAGLNRRDEEEIE